MTPPDRPSGTSGDLGKGSGDERSVEGTAGLASFRRRAAQLRRAGWARLRGGQLTPKRAALSVALGLFIGSLPVYGLHLPLCVALCVPLRLDTPVAYLAANISNPFIAPWLVFLEVQAGALLLTGDVVPFSVNAARETGIGGFVLFAALGSIVVGIGLAAMGGGLSAALVSWVLSRKHRGTKHEGP